MAVALDQLLGELGVSDDYAYLPYPGFSPAAHRREGAKRALAALDGAQRVSGQQIAAQVVSGQIERHSRDQSLPPLVTRFLEQHWRSHMMRVHVRDGDQGERWHDAVETMDQLVWSVRPKVGEASRKRLFAVLPGLLQRLHAGLQSEGLSTADEDVIFAGLAQLHAAALHAERPAAGASANDPREANATAGTGARDEGAGDGGRVSAGPLPVSRESPRVPAAATRGDDVLGDLVIGDSIEFHAGRARSRIMQLTWVSGQRGVFLFRDRQGDDEICLTAERLIQHMREHSVCVLTS